MLDYSGAPLQSKATERHTMDRKNLQGHSTNLFLQISVLGTTSCWLANYFCVATLLGNNHGSFFPGKIISRWRRPGLKD